MVTFTLRVNMNGLNTVEDLREYLYNKIKNCQFSEHTKNNMIDEMKKYINPKIEIINMEIIGT